MKLRLLTAAFLGSLGQFLLLHSCGVCGPTPANAAVRVPLTWTAPARATRYEAIARRGDGVFLSPTLYAESTGTAPPVPAAAGSAQRVWVLISEDWRAGGWMIWARGCNDSACAPWSNAVLVAAGLPDTNWMLERSAGKGVRAPRGGSVWLRARGRAGWSLQPGDTVATARIVHQEDVQRAESLRLCELYGYWQLRGRVSTCP